MTFPSEQTVFRVTDTTGFQNVKEFKEPLSVELDKNEVLVKIKAVALNFRDLAIATGRYPGHVDDNMIAASDASGEVVKVGSQVYDFEIGDRVINNFDPDNLYGPPKMRTKPSSARSDGVLCQYKIFNSAALNKLPKDTHLSHEEAASLVCTGCTAWNSLYGSGNPFVAGQSVLLLGTGGVSVTALVLAKAAGAVTIITSSSDEKLEFVKEKYGADHTINYKTHPNWDQKVLEITNGQGVDFVLDIGGNGTISKSLSSITSGGQIAVIGFLDNFTEKPDLITSIIIKSAHIRGIIVSSKQLAEELIRFVHAKKLRMPVEKVHKFTQEEVHLAYTEIMKQSQIGKIVIKVD